MKNIKTEIENDKVLALNDGRVISVGYKRDEGSKMFRVINIEKKHMIFVKKEM